MANRTQVQVNETAHQDEAPAAESGRSPERQQQSQRQQQEQQQQQQL